MNTALFGLLLACSGADTTPEADAVDETQAVEGASSEVGAAVEGGQPEAEDTGASAAVVVASDAEDPVAHSAKRLAARHLIIAYEGARKAPPGTSRSRKEARELASQARARVVAGADFADVAREVSEGPSASLGGMLGSFEPGTMDPLFEEALVALPEGGLSEPVETPFGFHIIERVPLREYHLAHVLVQWQGLRHATTERTQEEAKQRADEALAALESGQPVAEVARSWSDGPSAAWGGDLGWMLKGQMTRPFDEAAFALEPGQHSAIIETPLGYHIITRVE